MTVVLILSILILAIVLVLILGGANQRRIRKKELNKEAKRESKRYVDIFDENKEDIQLGETADAKEHSEKEEKIDPSEIGDILSESKDEKVEEEKEVSYEDMKPEDFLAVLNKQSGSWNDEDLKINTNTQQDKIFDENVTKEEEEPQKPKDEIDLGEAEFNEDLFGDLFKDNNDKEG